jgi:S1-C subfamily serine protease
VVADLVVVLLVVVLGVVGHRQGAVAALLTLLGFAMGIAVGSGLARILLEGGRSSSYVPLASLVGALSFAVLFSTVLHDVYRLLRAQHGWRVPPLDHALGAVLGGLVGLGVCWAGGAAIVTTPGVGGIQTDVLGSSVLEVVNGVVPPPSRLFGALVEYDPFPTLDASSNRIAAPPDDVPANPVLRVAADSVVRVEGTSCGYAVSGSGWVAAPGVVVTNVHVVAGQHDTEVHLHDGRTLAATPVTVDAGDDIAVLRVDGLGLPALRAARRPAGGTAAAIVGYPGGRSRSVVAGRLGVRERVRTSDALGKHEVERAVVGFRGPVHHGNSGGPLLDEHGEVLATVFAAASGGERGGFAVPNDVVESIVRDAGSERVESSCGR